MLACPVSRRRAAHLLVSRFHLAAALSLGCACAVSVVACGQGPLPPPTPLTVTLARPIGSWAGRGGFQTEFFYSEHGKFKVYWDTKALPAARTTVADGSADGAPYFELKLQSGVSGRQLGDAVERRTSDKGVLEFNEDPRDFYFAVRATAMEWRFRVEELFTTQVAASGAAAPPATTR